MLLSGVKPTEIGAGQFGYGIILCGATVGKLLHQRGPSLGIQFPDVCGDIHRGQQRTMRALSDHTGGINGGVTQQGAHGAG